MSWLKLKMKWYKRYWKFSVKNFKKYWYLIILLWVAKAAVVYFILKETAILLIGGLK